MLAENMIELQQCDLNLFYIPPHRAYSQCSIGSYQHLAIRWPTLPIMQSCTTCPRIFWAASQIGIKSTQYTDREQLLCGVLRANRTAFHSRLALLNGI